MLNLNLFSCFHGSSSKTGEPSTRTKTDKDVDPILEVFCKSTPTVLQTAVDEFIRAPKGSKAAVREAAKIELTLTHGSDPNRPSSPVFSHLSKAIVHDRPWLFQKLLNQPKIDINQPLIGYPPLYHAVQKGNVTALQALLKKNAIVSRRTIRLAALSGQPEIVRILRAKQPGIADNALFERIAKRQQQQIETWRRYSLGDRNERLEYILNKDVDDISMINRLLKVRAVVLAGADPNTRYEHSNRPLHVAAIYNEEQGGPELIRFLLTMGADPNMRNADGETPLYIAATRKNTPVLKMLLRGGADPNIANHLGDTPLGWATLFKQEAIIKALQEAGAHPLRPTKSEHSRCESILETGEPSNRNQQEKV